MLLGLLLLFSLLTAVSGGFVVYHGLMFARQLWAVMVLVVSKGNPEIAVKMEQLAGDSLWFCAVWFGAAVFWLALFGISALRFILAG